MEMFAILINYLYSIEIVSMKKLLINKLYYFIFYN